MNVSFLILENFRALKELQRLEIHLLMEGKTNVFKSFSLAKLFLGSLI